MVRLTLSLLGPVQIALDGQPVTGLAYAKVRALLAYLAVERRPHSRDALADLFWPGQSTVAARRSLRVALTTLRQAIGDQAAPIPFVLANRESVQINPASAVSLDISTFANLLRASEPHAHSVGALCPECAAWLTQAVGLYRGDFMQQLVVHGSAAFDAWVTLLQEQLHCAALEALAQLAAHHEARGADDLARQYAWWQLALELWNEGQRAAALAQYRRCRQVLASELGVEPSAETVALYEQIRDNTLRIQNTTLRSRPTFEEPFSMHNSQFHSTTLSTQ